MNPANFRKMTPYFILVLGVGMLIYFGSMAHPAREPKQPAAETTEVTQAATETTAALETAPAEEIQSVTLEDLYGENYTQELEEIILMQMENRMNKPPHISYYPIVEDAPLEDYVQIGSGTEFTLEEDGSVTISFLPGSVADEEHGIQSFHIPKQ